MFEKQIEAGVEFLNKNYPGWLEKINLDKLDMADSTNCTLGQLAGFYSTREEFRLSWDDCDGLGFSCTEDYTLLQKMWVNKIKELRSV